MLESAIKNYCSHTADTAIFPGAGTAAGFDYVGLGLIGEAGEVCDLIKKMLRDDDGQMTDVRRLKLVKEIGDVMWYWSETHACLELDPVLTVEAQQSMMAPTKTVPAMAKDLGFFAAHIAAVNDVTDMEQRQEALQILACMLKTMVELCEDVNINFVNVLETNYKKLISRKERDVLGGDGDNR